ncbi:MAG: transglutaminase family protein [Planctomycetota bacterium]
MRYRITHETEYHYAMPVSVGQNQVFLRPRDLPGRQRCIGSIIDFEPSPAISNIRRDYFGNESTLFSIQEPHAHMNVIAVSEVEVTPPGPPIPGMSPAWETVRDGARRDHTATGLETLQYIYDSPLVGVLPALTAYAQESFPAGKPIFDGALELTQRIFADFKYDPTTTTVSTPVDEVFDQRSGVCQDFSHLQIAMLRGLGLPARYVSGYLRTFRDESDPKLIGADASHAWLAVGDGQGHWTDYDPTNNQIPGEHHVTVAWGRDYSDVCPVRGVIVGGGDQSIDVQVKVTPI